MSHPRPSSPRLTVVHRSIPGPRSADPVDRQVHRRLLDLSACGFRVELVPLELMPEGGAPIGLGLHGVEVRNEWRRTARSRIEDSIAAADGVVLRGLAHPRAVLDTVSSPGHRLVVEVDALPSAAVRAGAATFRPVEQPGLATEVEHLVQRELRVLERADLVLCSSADTARDIEMLGIAATVVAPTVDRTAAIRTDDPAPPRIAVPGRFSDEFATPDERVLIAHLGELLRAASAEKDDIAVVAEDAVPLLRRATQCRYPMAPLADAAAITSTARVVLDVRRHGLPTHVRRAELIGAGVPFVASMTALGNDDLDGMAADLAGDTTEAQAALLGQLLHDDGLRDDVIHRLDRLAERHRPGTTRPALVRALATAGLRGEPADAATTDTGDEYTRRSSAGTLADSDHRIAALEERMVPHRVLDRHDSINLQSTLDADGRYRVFARTHLESEPATAPPRPHRPATFSVLVPTWNTDVDLLAACLDSVAMQTYPEWELCVVDDGSTSTAHHELLRRRAEEDPRVRVRFNPYNQGIALASNDALAMATGEWVVLLDHDDILKPDALAWVAAYVDACDDYDVWYSDEDKLSPDGRLVMPFFKPDWSPDLLLGVNYVCHLLAARRSLVESVGGFRAGFDGAQDFDLVLRLVEGARRVGHIAKPLYSWRMIPGSTALDTGSKPAAHHAGQRAIRDALDRRFEAATVADGWADTTHRVRYAVETEQLLTVMIPTRDRADLLRSCVEGLRRTSAGLRIELLVIDNQSTDPTTVEYLLGLERQGHQVVRYPHEFSFARQVNLGALHARGDLLLILNNDTVPQRDDWLLRMMEHAQRPEVGIVGARLMFPEGTRNDRPQHEGIVLGMAGLAYNIDLGGYMGLDQFVRDCSSVTAACVMLRPSVLFSVGGMEEHLRVAYNDVDFGVRTSEFGYRVVYTPHSVLEHPESASRKDLHPTEDEEWFVERWGPKGAVRDPFVNPHFEWLMPVFYRL